MNYVKQSAAFDKWCQFHFLPPMAQLLWRKLFMYFNINEWSDEWISLSNARLMSDMQISAKNEKSFIAYRNKLVENGLIICIKGKKSSPTQYKLIPLYNEKEKKAETKWTETTINIPVNVPVNMPVNVPVKTEVSDVEKPAEESGETASCFTRACKTKQNKTKKTYKKTDENEKTDEPKKKNTSDDVPLPSDDDSLIVNNKNADIHTQDEIISKSGVDVDVDADEYFNAIYSEYPRKEGKIKGKSAYLKYLTKGKKFAGQSAVKYNHAQIRVAVQEFAFRCKEEELDVKYIPMFSTFMNSRIVDFIENPENCIEQKYQAAMYQKYGDVWNKLKFRYIIGGSKQ